MADIIDFGRGKTPAGPVEETPQPIPEYDYEVTYAGDEAPPPEVIRGFLTIMGNYYFIGRGVPNKIDWVWSAPQDRVFKITGIPVTDA